MKTLLTILTINLVILSMPDPNSFVLQNTETKEIVKWSGIDEDFRLHNYMPGDTLRVYVGKNGIGTYNY